jgi:glutaredoxin
MITLYTIDGCAICAQAKQHLNQQIIPFKEMNILHTPDAQKELKEVNGEIYTPVLKSDKGIYRGLDILNYTKEEG